MVLAREKIFTIKNHHKLLFFYFLNFNQQSSVMCARCVNKFMLTMPPKFRFFQINNKNTKQNGQNNTNKQKELCQVFVSVVVFFLIIILKKFNF